MAGNNKSNSSNSNRNTSKSNTRNNNRSKKNSKQQEVIEEKDFSSEIIFWIVAAIMLILELGNFGACGFVEYISKFLFGIFGVVEYILPILVIFTILFLHANNYKKRSIQKVCLGGLLVLFIGVLAQMIEGVDKVSVLELFKNAFEEQTGGGILCGGIAYLLHMLIGTAGTYIIIALAIILCIVFVAEVSVIDLIKSAASNIAERPEEDDDYEEYEVIAKKKNPKKRNSTIVEEDYSEERAKEQKKTSMLEQLTVLPADTDQGIIQNKELDVNTEEDVHEITMQYEVPLPGELMGDVVKEEQPKRKPRTKKTIVPTVEEVKTEASIPMEENVVSKPIAPTAIVQKDTISISNSEKIQNKTAEPTKTLSSKEIGKSDADYKFPPLDLLKPAKGQSQNNAQLMAQNAERLREVLESFGVKVKMENYSCGPSVTRYEMIPEQGVKVSKITGLADDLMMNLAAQSIRIEAPIPGKRAVGIEIPNETRSPVGFRELIDTEKFMNKCKSKISFAVGKDIEGNVIVEDIAKMPHLLIAGATGSGKSVCTNTLIMSILYKARPDEVKMILVDPKQVELKVYNGIPHLLTPVVTDPKQAAGALNWAVAEMTKRYQQFSELNVRNIEGYNKKAKELESKKQEVETHLKPLPQIVIIVDELADLMMVAKAEVEEAIVRLAQLARAAGIHLVIATQRPSVDVVTGLIKANVPSRIALSVSSGTDSRTIIDSIGAEKLLGNGDMLFSPTGYPKPLRVQGAYISDEEVMNVVDFLIENNKKEEETEDISSQFVVAESAKAIQNVGNGPVDDGNDEYFYQAGKYIIEKNKASIGMLQRMFRIGFNRAARIMEQLHTAGVVSAEEGTKPRQVTMSLEEFEATYGSGEDSDTATF